MVLALAADADWAFAVAEQVAGAAAALLLYLELQLDGLHHALQVVHAGLEVVAALRALLVLRLFAREQVCDALAFALVLEECHPAALLLDFRLP